MTEDFSPVLKGTFEDSPPPDGIPEPCAAMYGALFLLTGAAKIGVVPSVPLGATHGSRTRTRD